jgi:hypothetical protein
VCGTRRSSPTCRIAMCSLTQQNLEQPGNQAILAWQYIVHSTMYHVQQQQQQLDMACVTRLQQLHGCWFCSPLRDFLFVLVAHSPGPILHLGQRSNKQQQNIPPLAGRLLGAFDAVSFATADIKTMRPASQHKPKVPSSHRRGWLSDPNCSDATNHVVPPPVYIVTLCTVRLCCRSTSSSARLCTILTM